jgi:hypothetical protein
MSLSKGAKLGIGAAIVGGLAAIGTAIAVGARGSSTSAPLRGAGGGNGVNFNRVRGKACGCGR